MAATVWGRLDGRVVFAPFVLPGGTDQRQSGAGKARVVACPDIGPSCNRRRNVWRPPARFSADVADATTSMPGTIFKSPPSAAILAEEVRRVGKMEPPAEIAVITGEPWGYPQSRAVAGGQRASWAIGKPDRTNSCAISGCPIASPAINRAIQTLNEMLRDSRWPRMVRSIELFSDENQGAIERSGDRPAGGAALLRMVRGTHTGDGGRRPGL